MSGSDVERTLAQWREAERAVDETPPDSTDRAEAVHHAEEARDAYQAEVESQHEAAPPLASVEASA
jgi:hypothetical protein